MSTLIAKLRDTAWGGVAALTGIASVLTTIIVSVILNPPPTPLSNDRMMIYPTASKRLSDFSESLDGRISLHIDDKEEQDVKLFIYIVEFKASNNRVLEAGDFYQPIKISVPADRKIITVVKSFDTEPPVRVDERGGMVDNVPRPLEFKAIREGEQTFRIEPQPMNAGDWFKVEVYTGAHTAEQTPANVSAAAKQGGNQKAEKEVNWSCHVKNVQCPAGFTLDLNLPRLGESMWFLRVRVNHHGWAIYFIILFAVISLLLLLLLAQKAGMVQGLSYKEMFFISLGVVSSLATGEVIADSFFNGSGYDKQPLIAWIILAIHFLILLVLGCYVVGHFFVRKSTPSQPNAASGSATASP